MRRWPVTLLGVLALLSTSCGGNSKDDGGALGADAVTSCPATPARVVEHTDPVPVRRDLAAGQPGDTLQVRLRVVDVKGCAPLAGLTVQVWHAGLDGTSVLSGAQRTNAAGLVTFRTVRPGDTPPHLAVRVLDGTTVVLATEVFLDGAPVPGTALVLGPPAPDGGRVATAVLGVKRSS